MDWLGTLNSGVPSDLEGTSTTNLSRAQAPGPGNKHPFEAVGACHRNDSNPFLTKRNDSCPFRKRLRPTHPAKFSHASTSLGGLTVTVGRNPS